ncbi:hypothetical protein PZ897_19815 [Hoeflea sp. YIM 152468]|uniref:hypothetical protein n=1 Tax=Hoeflea sp. YIM 152468 TaxID=3031759 RepID=UPI0023DCCFFF|nr:hypothetical protein [Hoeflea sp. YIM 152468]MDF1610434.1 hypothetical protein [Hoeflea sp. YIM 152468]
MAAPSSNSELAVLTGDIVGSAKLDPGHLRTLLDEICQAAVRFQIPYPGSIIGSADVFRGDSWQIAVAAPQLALRFAVYVRATAIASGLADTRIFLGFGTSSSIHERTTSLSTGEAFEISGRGVDGLRSERLGISFGNKATTAAAFGKAAAALLDALIRDWTPKQAGAVRQVLEKPGLSDAAIVGDPASDSERRNFTKLRNRAHCDAILVALEEWEALPRWAKGPNSDP